MPSPTLGEIAYTAFATVQPTPQPLYKALTYEERLGWGVGVHAAVVAVVAPEYVAPPLGRDPPLLALIHALRQRVVQHMQEHQLSLKRAGQQCGIDRHTLSRWLEGEENIAVHTLLAVEAWISSGEDWSAPAGSPRRTPDTAQESSQNSSSSGP